MARAFPQLVRQLFWQVPDNDANRLEDVLKKHGDTIAAVLIEPILGNCCGIPSKPEFIKAVRELCDKYGVLMIVDEVKTGFRVAKGGAQELYGVKADICTIAKAVAQRLSDRRASAGARTSCAHSGAASPMAAPIPPRR